MSRTEDLVAVKPAARRMWRIGGRRRERWRGEGEAMVCLGGLDWIHQKSLVVKDTSMSNCLYIVIHFYSDIHSSLTLDANPERNAWQSHLRSNLLISRRKNTENSLVFVANARL